MPAAPIAISASFGSVNFAAASATRERGRLLRGFVIAAGAWVGIGGVSKRKLSCGQNCAELRAAYRGGAGAAAEPRDGEVRRSLVRRGRGGSEGDHEEAAERHTARCCALGMRERQKAEAAAQCTLAAEFGGRCARVARVVKSGARRTSRSLLRWPPS